MKEFYEFDEERYQRKNRLKGYIAVALIFALLGGIAVYAISPYLADRNTPENPSIVQEGGTPPEGQGNTKPVTKVEEETTIGSNEDLYITR